MYYANYLKFLERARSEAIYSIGFSNLDLKRTNDVIIVVKSCNINYIRPAKFIPESKRLNVLLNEFKASRNHIAIVIDEHSNISGLVTLEDLIEEIIGEIDDEHDISSKELIIQQANNKYIIDALLSLDDFNQKFDCNLVDKDIETIGGFLVNKFEKVPKKQETLESEDFLFTVLSADSKKINRIQLTIRKDRKKI